MLSEKARNIIQELADHLAGQVGLELVQQGHNNTGTLIESVRMTVTESLEGVVIECSTLDYGTYLDTGRRPGKMPPVDALKKWVEQRGIASEQREIQSIAFAIGKAIEREGSPTRGAYKFSKNGRRTNWINEVLAGNEEIIAEKIDAALTADYEVKINNVLIDVEKLIK